MPRSITSGTSLEQLRREAKRWLKALRAGTPGARARLERMHPNAPAAPVLRDLQHALALEYGFESWIALKEALANRPAGRDAPPRRARTSAEYETVARDMVAAFNDHDEAALARLNDHYQRTFTFDDLWAEIWRRVYAFRQRAFKGGPQQIHLSEAQIVIAGDAGFGSWDALIRAMTTGAPRVPPYEIDEQQNRITPRRQLTDKEWDEVIDVMKERRIAALGADGQMTDAVLARIARLDHVTALSLGGSRQLTDDGLLQLANMPQLRALDLNEYPGGKLTDRGLAVLRHLPNLTTFDMTWQRGITDAGASSLRFCEQLESVNLMGSPTGDGAIEALQGKPKLKRFSSGRLVTDAGLPLLQNFPMLKVWHGEPLRPDTTDAPLAGHLLIDGPFTDNGLAGLAGLEGVGELDLFWHVTGITSAGFAHLIDLPNLAMLGADGRLSGNAAMRHIGAMPRLRRLRAQESVATDEGFEALARSKTLESFWGRVCPNFGSRGFVALSRMPALRGLGIGCKNVDDAALATLPAFPALRELTPIDFTDEGFRHIGRCERLERLTCMYCRDTTDAATEHLTGLRIRYYYAGLTRITDRSLELLSRISTLEKIELYECGGVTDTGLAFLAAIPNLREVDIAGVPGVTWEGTRALPERIRVKYCT